MLKLISVHFYFLMWLLENFICVLTFLLESSDLDNMPEDLMGILIMRHTWFFFPLQINFFGLTAQLVGF